MKFVTSSKWSFVWGGGVGETFGEGGGAGPHRPSWGCFGKRRCIKLGDFILLLILYVLLLLFICHKHS